MFIRFIVVGSVIFFTALLQVVFDKIIIKIDFSTIPAWKLSASRVMYLLRGGAIGAMAVWFLSN